MLLPKDEIQFSVNDQIFLETLLMEMRGKTISYSAYKKLQTNEIENKLCHKIKELEENVDANRNLLEELR